jgi:hypothetical protein
MPGVEGRKKFTSSRLMGGIDKLQLLRVEDK